jgi:hypothetical protein
LYSISDKFFFVSHHQHRHKSREGITPNLAVVLLKNPGHYISKFYILYDDESKFGLEGVGDKAPTGFFWYTFFKPP